MNKKAFGENLKNLRKQKGLSQAQLAEIIGMSAKNITKIETGKSFPRAENINKLLKLFNVSENVLFSGSDKFEIKQNSNKIEALKIINNASDKHIKIYLSMLKQLRDMINQTEEMLKKQAFFIKLTKFGRN